MRATVSYLLMLQKYINLKQKTNKQKIIHRVQVIFQKILQLIIYIYIYKTGLKGVVKFFSVDFNRTDTNDMLDIHKYLMKRNDIK